MEETDLVVAHALLIDEQLGVSKSSTGFTENGGSSG